MRRVIGMDIHRTFAEVVIRGTRAVTSGWSRRHDAHGVGGVRQDPARKR